MPILRLKKRSSVAFFFKQSCKFEKIDTVTDVNRVLITSCVLYRPIKRASTDILMDVRTCQTQRFYNWVCFDGSKLSQKALEYVTALVKWV